MTLYDKYLNEIAQGQFLRTFNSTEIKNERNKYITNNVAENNTIITNGGSKNNNNSS